jgi:hypothetical protein
LAHAPVDLQSGNSPLPRTEQRARIRRYDFEKIRADIDDRRTQANGLGSEMTPNLNIKKNDGAIEKSQLRSASALAGTRKRRPSNQNTTYSNHAGSTARISIRQGAI